MKKILLIIMIITILLLSSCSAQTNKVDKDSVLKNQNKNLSVVTTIFPLYEFAKIVGGDHVNVLLLLPPGAEPHSYEPKVSDIKKIDNADVFIYVGEIMEPWAKDILEGVNNKNVHVIKASSLVNLLKNKENSYDPHIWLNLKNDQKIVKEIAKTFSSLDNNNSATYNSNANTYISKLQNLDQKYLTELSSCNKTEFIVGGHNFFAYIENRYHIKGVPAIENLEPNTEPTPKRIQEITDIAKEHNIKYVLTEVLVNEQMAQAIASETNAKVLVFNPAGNLPKASFDKGVSFISVMKKNLETLKIALECN